MQGNDVEFWQILLSCDFGETGIEQSHAGASRVAKRACVCHMTRVKIGAPEFAGDCRGVDVERQPLPVPELEIAQRVPSRWFNASTQARKPQYPGAKLAVIAAGILNVGDVAFCPIHRAVRRVLGPSMQPLSSDGVTAQLRSAGGTSPR